MTVTAFQHIGRLELPLLAWHLLLGRRVAYLLADVSIEKSDWFRALVRGGRISWFSPPEDLKLQNTAHHWAVDNAQRVFEQTRHSSLPARIEELLRSPDARLVYMKLWSDRLFHARHARALLRQLSKTADAPLLLVPGESRYVARAAGIEEPVGEGAGISRFGVWAEGLRRNAVRAKYMAFIAGLPVWACWKMLHAGGPQPQPRTYALGVRTFVDDWVFDPTYRAVDFLLDGKDLRADNTLFCAESPMRADQIREFKRRGYNLVDFLGSLDSVSRDFVRETFFGRFLPIWTRVFISMWTADEVTLIGTMRSLRWYLLWQGFLERHRPQNYIVSSNNEASHIVRNILFSQKGIGTAMYDHSAAFVDTMTPLGQPVSRHYIYSNLLFDRIFCWNEKSRRFHQAHHNKIGEYSVVGCLWSEHAASLTEGEKKEFLDALARKNGKPIGTGPIVGVYDTSFGDREVFSLDAMGVFIGGILRLLDAFPEITVVFKEKKKRLHQLIIDPQIVPMYDSLCSHPRVLRTGDEFFDPAPLIAVSDLSLAASFTSPVLEALGARRKALYYDFLGCFKNTYYDQFPDLVAHDYESLVRLVRHWLYNVDAEAFSAYLEEHVRGELDAGVDGKAITRLHRELLRGSFVDSVQAKV
jgi:polysaccharide biosynthesis PFTS motif protein